jgi:hypothetical protein
MRLFPGRTPEELDDIDMARLSRALDARRIEGLENKRRLWLDKEIKTIDPDDWLAIQEYEGWLDGERNRTDAVDH